ncbi:Fructosamine kinase-domain-containing protein [Annulohypoxylon truncatum]|uniref:Fructosamine kinase-domain-containing protein n=1 Tax=Annulohypoxylon truncatum TaxID=327061 RepID=UPI0020076685|nr:Fructosamine kinase-domain-containing protein [Annulohypoxylon truncatum]KAI1214672.1 Fructosamine kinase-domain-containing protein [Annulohypoxylon truncatum]
MSSDSSEWVSEIKGNFPINRAVLKVMPNGTRIVSAESNGTSAWSKTAKVSVILQDGTKKNYFLKCATGQGARALAFGEFHSASAINEVVPKLVPKPCGCGEYQNGESTVYFFLGDFHDMDLSGIPEPAEFMSKIAELHEKGTSPNGMFGYPVPTVCGKMERTVTWETSWAKSFTHQLQDVIKYDNETNGVWPEYDAACKQLIDVVIPRLLGALQSDGRNITPSLIHGDLWERNIGIDMETGEPVLFDPGCTYAHHEMEFGTWRCTWANYFNSNTRIYTRLYQRHIVPSNPVAEWDDRNRLYSIHPYLNDSAGHPGSISRQIAYNDMLYLCEKYGPLDSLEKYNPEKDISL